MNHTAACIARHAAHEDYFWHWPKHCRKCHGSGVIEWSENQSPLSSGMYWPETFSEFCSACFQASQCPRCGYQHADTWNDHLYENPDDPWTPCAACGFDGTQSCPDDECYCWEVEFDQHIAAEHAEARSIEADVLEMRQYAHGGVYERYQDLYELYDEEPTQ